MMIHAYNILKLHCVDSVFLVEMFLWLNRFLIDNKECELKCEFTDLEIILYHPQGWPPHKAEPPERCTMQPVQSAESNVRSHSSLTDPDQYIAAIATRGIGPPGRLEDTEDAKRIWPINFSEAANQTLLKLISFFEAGISNLLLIC